MPFQFRHCWTFDKNILSDLHLETLLHHLELNRLERMNHHLQPEGQGEKKKRQKETAVFPDHWFYLSFIILSYEGKEGRWNFVPSKLGVRSNAWQPGETLQKMLNCWLRCLFHTALAVPPKGIGHTGTSCDTSPDLCMHIANSRCTLHSGTVLMKLGVCINKELSYR